MHEPRPARAELVDAGVLELGLEVVEGAERRVDRAGAGRRRARRRRPGLMPLPEQRVVVVAAAVVADRRRACRRAAARGSCSTSSIGLSAQLGALERGVDLVDVGLVVLVVVHSHRRLVDVRLERVVGVGERRD